MNSLANYCKGVFICVGLSDKGYGIEVAPSTKKQRKMIGTLRNFRLPSFSVVL
jgi:hypothetical protein